MDKTRLQELMDFFDANDLEDLVFLMDEKMTKIEKRLEEALKQEPLPQRNYRHG